MLLSVGQLNQLIQGSGDIRQPGENSEEHKWTITNILRSVLKWPAPLCKPNLMLSPEPFQMLKKEKQRKASDKYMWINPHIHSENQQIRIPLKNAGPHDKVL